MNYFKIVIINSNGSVDTIGNDPEKLHSVYLLDYAKQKYDSEIFKRLNFRHRPQVISYFLVSLYNDIIFLNTTKDVKKYGYMGILILPDSISASQEESLHSFLDKIENFDIFLATDLTLKEGLVQANELYPVSNETPKDLVKRYLGSRNM